MTDNQDPRDQLILRLVTALDRLMEFAHEGAAVRKIDPELQSHFIEGKAALGWGKLYLTAKRDLDQNDPLSAVLIDIAKAGSR